MSVVNRLCDFGLWLDGGKAVAQGPMEDVVRQYLGSGTASEAQYAVADMSLAPGNEVIRLRGVRVRDHRGQVTSSIDARFPTTIEIEHAVLQRSPVRTSFRLASAEGAILFTSADTDDDERHGMNREPGVYISRCELPPHLLKRGLYFVTVMSDISMVKANFHVENVVSFTVDLIDAKFEDNRVGLVAPALPWEVEKVSELETAARAVESFRGSSGLTA